MDIEVNDIALPHNTILQQRYLIREVYYLGHFGIVYFGWDTHANSDIVIKEFMPYLIANRDMDGMTVICKSAGRMEQYRKAQEMFLNECEYVRRLRNIKKPYEGCVLKYLDGFEENGTQYLITERIHGRSLQDYIENGDDFSVRHTMQMLVSIVRQIHKRGMIHCDIKPSNIILREDGRIALIDFGSASYRRNNKVHEMVSVSRGYSAPELYHGERLDYRADIYSIGAVIYYILTDHQLPEPDEEDREGIPAISEFTQIPEKLEQVILKTLNWDKKKRPKSLLLLQYRLKQ